MKFHFSIILSALTLLCLLLSNKVGMAQSSHLENFEPIVPTVNINQSYQEPSLAQTADLDTPSNLIILPRYSGTFTTGDGVGYESSFGSISVFIPVTQEAEHNLLFFDGRLNIDTEDANLGGNIILGYREYNPNANIVFGYYLGTDIQETINNSTFNQIGLGFEVLGDPWEFRANGYIPVGDKRDLIADTGVFTTGDYNFQGHYLAYDTAQIKTYEEALTGLDLEGGMRLFDWTSGDLRGYLGTYMYDSSNSAGVIGFSSRLLARVTDNFNAGVSLTTDGEYGTNVVFTVGASFGGAESAKEDQTLEDSMMARLGDQLNRRTNITVQQQTETIKVEDIPVTNPKTGDPWYFVHVAPGGNSDGTFEDPFGNMPDAIAVAPSDVDTIIYVDNFAVLPGDFTIPDLIQVLSRGPLQNIDTNELGSISIPFSGNGTTFPTIAGTVTMGNDNTVSGFTINAPDGQNGIEANGVSNPLIEYNTISGGVNGINLADVTGTATIDQNQISGSTNDGIAVTQNTGTLDNVILTMNNITDTTGDGIAITANNGGTITNFTLTRNTVNNAGQNGINATGVSNPLIEYNTINGGFNGINLADVTGTATIDQNQISGSTNDGIAVTQNTGTLDNVILTMNNITGTTEDGIEIIANNGGIITNMTLIGNTINTVGNDGFFVNANLGGIINNVTISGSNVISNTGQNSTAGGDGIEIRARGANSQIQNVSITGVNISNTLQEGIEIDGQDGGTIGNATISDNTVTNAGQQGIQIHTHNENIPDQSILDTVIVSNNTITGSGESGIRVQTENDNNQINSITVTGNTIDNSQGGDGILVRTQNASQITTATLTGNTITNSANNGILVRTAGDNSSITTLTVSDNNIDTSANYGIRLHAQNTGSLIETATLTGNTLNNSGSNGIDITTENDAIITTLTVSDNNLDNSTENGVAINTQDGSSITNLTFSNNTINNSGTTGLEIRTQNTSKIANGTISNNTVTNSQNYGIGIATPAQSSFCSIFTNNTVNNSNLSAGLFREFAFSEANNANLSIVGSVIALNNNATAITNITTNNTIANNDIFVVNGTISSIASCPITP